MWFCHRWADSVPVTDSSARAPLRGGYGKQASTPREPRESETVSGYFYRVEADEEDVDENMPEVREAVRMNAGISAMGYRYATRRTQSAAGREEEDRREKVKRGKRTAYVQSPRRARQLIVLRRGGTAPCAVTQNAERTGCQMRQCFGGDESVQRRGMSGRRVCTASGGERQLLGPSNILLESPCSLKWEREVFRSTLGGPQGLDAPAELEGGEEGNGGVSRAPWELF
ncbi:hypothetical protein DFH06DRAFT_1141226 [Mycena polygramma]|nr:hypothetical protein DFH06DRAFT_1141226 [Mycena polygramma]